SGTCLCTRSISKQIPRGGKGPFDSRDTLCCPSLRRFFSRPSESRSATYLSPSLFEHRLTWVDYDSVILQDFKSWTKIGVTVAYLSESDEHKSAKQTQH